MTKIVSCTCAHPYQDKTYGKGKRAANQVLNGNYRCTVCKSMHTGAKEAPAGEVSKSVSGN